MMTVSLSLINCCLELYNLTSSKTFLVGIKTRRSTRCTNIKKEDDVPVVAVETLNKLKQVVDSDSE